VRYQAFLLRAVNRIGRGSGGWRTRAVCVERACGAGNRMLLAALYVAALLTPHLDDPKGLLVFPANAIVLAPFRPVAVMMPRGPAMDEVGTVVHFRNDGSVNYRIVIAGPNGAGKTTFARRYPPKDHAGVIRFVNADRVSASLVIITPESTPKLRVCGALGSTKSDGRAIWWLSTWSRGQALADGHCSGNLADDEDSTWQIRLKRTFKGTLCKWS